MGTLIHFYTHFSLVKGVSMNFQSRPQMSTLVILVFMVSLYGDHRDCWEVSTWTLGLYLLLNTLVDSRVESKEYAIKEEKNIIMK